jgi:PadR family transcriptional regulator, regulatory protein AphA
MSRELGKLTTTSYAVLGLLAIKPWTTYELIQQIGRGVDRFWPRSRSKLFEEPKKLVAHGLAEASPSRIGKRPRTRYAITDDGRRALAEWLAAQSQQPLLESEHLLKVFFAEQGAKENLQGTIAAMRDWAEEDAALHAGIARSYLAGIGQFPERAAVVILTGRYLAELADMTRRWADWASEVVESWPEDLRAAEPDWASFAAVASLTGPPLPEASLLSGPAASDAQPG